MRVGILGGGQLAKMSALAAYKLGLNINILEKQINSPAGVMTKDDFVGWVDDDNILKSFSKNCDVITLESEFVDSNRLRFLENIGKSVIPSSDTIELIQDKFIQKSTFKSFGIPLPKFMDVTSKNEYHRVKELLKLPFVLKSKKLGYDGYGNAIIKSESEFISAFDNLTKRHSTLLAEEFINFSKELGVTVVRTVNEIKLYPVIETIQENSICKKVIAPCEINEELLKEAKEIAVNCVKSVNGFGIYSIEMFLTKNDEIVVNEIAPRPHNSAHYTIDACITSQFENHIRAVLNLPLGSTEMKKPFAIMINLLGKRNGNGELLNYNEVLSDPDISLHLYGKSESRIGRKMGHITIIGNNKTELLNRAEKIEKLANI
ncbi:MAG TPA: 5-(carboxyamino)imidazole ribonucleotide synthase [Melioribacteraceae bacterium]|nr:5-(carboxyamino)imidazole ribonucleotide synthase [Melioribacteraceae bacterium]